MTRDHGKGVLVAAKYSTVERIYQHIIARENARTAEEAAEGDAEAEAESSDQKAEAASDRKALIKKSKVAPKPGAPLKLPKEYKFNIQLKTQITGKDIRKDPEIVRELMERSDITIVTKMRGQSLEEACTVSESCGLCLCCLMLIFVGGLMGYLFQTF